MEKKLCISLIFSNFVVSKHKVIIFHAMHNLCKRLRVYTLHNKKAVTAD